jgi:twitching motility protein PilT
MKTESVDRDKALQAIDHLFETAVQKNASDLHIVVGKPPLLRVTGRITAIDDIAPLTREQAEALVFSLCTDIEKQRFMDVKELDIAHQIPTGQRFRINLHWEKTNVAMAARTIPDHIPTMDDLDLPQVVQKMTDYPHGLVLVTGPTGSGKSTTLAAMIDKINRNESVNIITLEDPIEFMFTPDRAVVRQRQLGQDFLAFSEGLKHILRQDPDVVMVGEMRDPETISTTLTIAETGHLVFATLHTYSAAQTIDRIIDAMPPHQQNQIRSQLALSLRAIISQQLLPKVGGGRVAAREILINNPAVANLIRENEVAQIKNVLQTSAGEGMCTLAQDLKKLIQTRVIEKEVAMQYLVGAEKLLAEDEPRTARKHWI